MMEGEKEREEKRKEMMKKKDDEIKTRMSLHDKENKREEKGERRM